MGVEGSPKIRSMRMSNVRMCHVGLRKVGQIGAVLLVMTIAAGYVEAAVLCANPSGSVFLRATCNGSEIKLDPVALGLVGPPGPDGPPGPPVHAGAHGQAVHIGPHGTDSSTGGYGTARPTGLQVPSCCLTS